MKTYKPIAALLITTLLSTLSYAQTLTLNGIQYKVDSLENHQVGPATQYVALRLTATGRRIDAFFLKTDVTNPYIDIRTALGQDSIYSGETTAALAKRKTSEGAFYFAGTNGDFYDTSGYVGYPVSGNMVNGEIAKIPGGRNVFTFSENKTPDIGKATYSGTVKTSGKTWAINSVNHLRAENQLVLYNQLNGKRTRTDSYGTEVLIQLQPGYAWGTNKTLKAKVLKIEKNIGSMAIPKGQAVLSGHGTAATNLNDLAVNDEIDIKLNIIINGNASANQLQMTGGDSYKIMLLNGVVETGSVWDELHPRTGLGYSITRDTVIFCVVDGRGLSQGVNTKQLAELMKSAGAWTAYNMDGGGSSTMYIAEYGKPVNALVSGAQRAVSNSVFVVATSPTDNNIGVIKPYKSSYILPRYAEFIPNFYGYNQYEVLLQTDLQGVELSCHESLGKIDGNKFIATGTEPGQVTASYQGVETVINVSFVPVDSIKLRLDSVIIDNREDYIIEVIGYTPTEKSLISPQTVDWTVADESICKIEKGVLRALKNGSTIVTGTIDGETDQMKVNVQIPEDKTIVSEIIEADAWGLAFSSQYKGKIALNQDNLPSGWAHGAAVNFTHAAGRSPYIELSKDISTYGLPDTIKMIMNLGDIDMLEAIATLHSHDGNSVATKVVTFKKNRDFSLDIPVSQAFDINDRNIYPIRFEKIRFFLNASGMVDKKDYTMAIKEIAFSYAGLEVSKLISQTQDYFDVYPNPVSNGELFIRLSDNSYSSIEVHLHDISGRTILAKTLNTNPSGIVNLAIDNLKAGMYFLQVQQNGQSNSVKLIIK